MKSPFRATTVLTMHNASNENRDNEDVVFAQDLFSFQRPARFNASTTSGGM